MRKNINDELSFPKWVLAILLLMLLWIPIFAVFKMVWQCSRCAL